MSGFTKLQPSRFSRKSKGAKRSPEEKGGQPTPQPKKITNQTVQPQEGFGSRKNTGKRSQSSHQRFGERRKRLASERRLPTTQMHLGKIGTPAGLDANFDASVKVVALGGLGEIGRNMYVVEYKDEILIIDAGVMFPHENMPGIDFIIPNTKYLEGKKKNIRALVLTHGHFDHVGALPYLLDGLGNPEIYTAELTKRMVQKRHAEFSHLPKPIIHTVKHGDRISIGQYLTLEFFHMNHNIPDDLAVLVETPNGNVLHTADFKFDPHPLNDMPVDLEKLREYGDRGILALMCDSTSAEKEGHSISEQTIYNNMETIFQQATGMIVAGTFSTMINRFQQIVQLSEKYGRKVVFDGYSIKTNIEITKEMGYVKIGKGTQIGVEQVREFPRDKITVIATGAMGQENASLMRIVNQEHRHLSINKGDTVIFSSSVIPGNERNVQYLKDMLYRAGVKVFHYQMMDIHAGGHAQEEDLREILRLVRPNFLIPHHGHYSMMVTLGKFGKEEGIPEENIIIADNGQIIHLTPERWWFDAQSAPSDYVMVDGLGVGDVGSVVLRDRQILSEDGMFVIVALVDGRNGKIRTSPDIISRGFVYLRENVDMLNDVRKKVRAIIEHKTMRDGPINWVYLKEEIREKIGQYLFQKTQRRPMVLPVIIEV